MPKNHDIWSGPEWDALHTAMHKMPECSHGEIGTFLRPHFHCWKPMIKINLFYRVESLIGIRVKFWVPVCNVCKFVGNPQNPKLVTL